MASHDAPPPTAPVPPVTVPVPPPPPFPPPPPYQPPSPTVTAPALREPAAPDRAGPDVAFTPVRQHGKALRGAPWGLLVLTLLAAAGVVFADANLVTVLILVACAVGALSTWLLALTRPGPRVTITRGILEVRTFDSHRVFDLTSPTTRVTVSGHPDDRSWRVEIARRRLSPYVVDHRTVDPREFTPAIWPYLLAAPTPAVTPAAPGRWS
jgi:hypothetical protein